MKSSKDYLLNVIVQGGSRVLAMSSSFIVFVLLARVLGAEAVGQFAFVMAFIMVAGNFAEFGITAALSKDLPHIRDSSDDDAAIYFGNYLLLRALLAVVVLVVALGIVWTFQPRLAEPLLIGCFAIPFIGARFCETVYQIYHRPTYTVYSSSWLAVSQLLMAVVLLFYVKVGVTGFMYGFVVTQFLYFCLCIYLTARLVSLRFRFQKHIVSGIAKIAVPVGGWTFFNIISTKADVFFLAFLRSSSELGIYNVAYRLLDLGIAVAITVATPLIPVLARKFKADAQKAKQDSLVILELTIATLLIVPLLLPHWAPLIVITLFGEEYAASIPLVGMFAWVLFLNGTMYISMSINLAVGDLNYSWWNGLLAAIANVALNFLLIPSMGTTGAAIAALVSNGLMLAVTLYFVRVNIGQFVSLRKCAKIVLAAAAPALLLHYVSSDLAPYFTPLALLLYLAALALLGLLPKSLSSAFRKAEQETEIE